MVAVTQLDYEKLILNYLRWKLTDPGSRGSTATETFSGNDSDVTFTMAQTGAKYFGTVTIGGATQNYIEHFTVDLKKTGVAPTITFRTAPTTGTNNISVTYGYGATWIQPFRPASTTTMPMIGLQKVSASSRTLAAGNPGRWYSPAYQVTVQVKREKEYTINSKTYTGNELVGYLADKVNLLLVSDALNGLFNIMDINQDASAQLPYDFEEKVTGVAETYSFKFAQRFS